MDRFERQHDGSIPQSTSTTSAARGRGRQTLSRVEGPVPSRVAWSFPTGRGPTITPSPSRTEGDGSAPVPRSRTDVGTSIAVQPEEAPRVDPESSSYETQPILPPITLQDFEL